MEKAGRNKVVCAGNERKIKNECFIVILLLGLLFLLSGCGRSDRETISEVSGSHSTVKSKSEKYMY